MRNQCAFLAVLLAFAFPAFAVDVVEKNVPNAKQVGTGRYSVVLWDVYDATLFAPQGKWDAAQPYALSIRYFREIPGADIAQRSVEEMRKQGYSDEAKLSQWQDQMRSIFPDVKKGSELTAILTSKSTTEFYSAGKPIGSIKDKEFGPHFFGIWLSEKTSEPDLRKKLLGLS